MSQLKTQLATAELRKFGLLFALILTVLFGLMIPLIRHGTAIASWPVWPWIAAIIIVAWALARPGSLWLLHTPWMKFANIAQWVNTRIIMLALFYLVILPIGLLLRLFGKDSMRRRFESETGSYRVPAEPHDSKHMENPY